MSAQSLREGSGGESVRGLLDEARAAEADDLTRSRALIQQARVLARSTGDLPGEAEALYRLAAITNQLGQLDEAFGLALEARDLAQRGAVVVVEVQALNQLAIVHSQAGNYADALQCSLRALELYRTTDDPAYEGSILNTIASIHHSLRDSDRAIVTYEAALEANRRRGRPDFDAITLANMAKVRAERNENLLAVSLGEAALELARDRLPLYVAEILADLAGAYSSLDMVTQAGRCIADASAALADLAEQGVDVPTSIALAVALAKGKVLIAGGQLEQAIDVLVEAATAAEGRGQSEEALVARQLLADVYKSLRRFEEALNERETCARLHEQIFNRDTDLRIKTLQISHDTQAARDQAELLRVRTTELEQMVAARTHDLEEQHYEAFERLAVIAEYRDADTAQHSTRVGALAAELALQIGEPAAWAKDLCLAGRLHDVGKVAVPDEILRKPGALTPAEYEIMKTHTTVGSSVFSSSRSALIQLAAEVAVSHHERWDGTGYPAGLAGEAIPLSGRIVAVADVYDALVTAHRYKSAWSSEEAVSHIVAGSGTHFEPRIADALAAVIARGEANPSPENPPRND